MKIYKNSLGIVCVEPDEGYLLKKGDIICKKAYLGKNDRAELYEQIVDENYIYEEKDVFILVNTIKIDHGKKLSRFLNTSRRKDLLLLTVLEKKRRPCLPHYTTRRNSVGLNADSIFEN